MNGPCYAFRHRDGSYRTCDTCGHAYWVHSHEVIVGDKHPYSGGYRVRHRIITRRQAWDRWALNAQPGDPEVDRRPRYRIMQERHVSISKFTAAAILKARARRSGIPIGQRRRATQDPVFTFMVVCRTCGNKRCPRATNSELPCSGSNESGQPGSRYATATKEQDWNF